MFLSGQIACNAEQHVLPGKGPPPRARSDATSLKLGAVPDLPSSQSEGSCRGAVPAVVAAKIVLQPIRGRCRRSRFSPLPQCSYTGPAKLGHGLGGGEWEATQDKGGSVSVGGRQMTTLCGVLGVVEAALGSSIPSLAHTALKMMTATMTLSSKPGSCLLIGSQVWQ